MRPSPGVHGRNYNQIHFAFGGHLTISADASPWVITLPLRGRATLRNEQPEAIHARQNLELFTNIGNRHGSANPVSNGWDH
jgi:hypothetical protein